MIPLLLVVLQGPLVVAGGGSLPDDVTRRTLDLAGGKDARVVVVPQASASGDAGERAARPWRQLGAARVDVLDPDRPDPLRRATLIWIGGGSQSRLMKSLEGTGVPELIRERRLAGAVVGGSSAGAAVQSKIMITGDTTPPAEGLALDDRVIFDQHFLARRRFGRLLDQVLKHPALVGVGIDEGTAVVVRGTVYEVIGRGRVVFVDAREAEGGRNLELHVLEAGQSFDLER